MLINADRLFWPGVLWNVRQIAVKILVDLTNSIHDSIYVIIIIAGSDIEACFYQLLIILVRNFLSTPLCSHHVTFKATADLQGCRPTASHTHTLAFGLLSAHTDAHAPSR